MASNTTTKALSGLPSATTQVQVQVWSADLSVVLTPWTTLSVTPIAGLDGQFAVAIPQPSTSVFTGQFAARLLDGSAATDIEPLGWLYVSHLSGGPGPQSSIAYAGIDGINSVDDVEGQGVVFVRDPPITYAGIISHLTGLDNWLANAAQSASRYDRKKIESLVPKMIARFQRQTHFRITQCQVSTRPDGTFPATVDTPLVREDGYAYYADDASDYLRIVLKTRPVQIVQRLRLTYQGVTVSEIPNSWLSVDRRSGQVEVVPYFSSAMYAGLAQAFAIFGMTAGMRTFLPNAWQVDYIAGLPVGAPDGTGYYQGGWQDDPEWGDLVMELEKYCALQVLYDIAHLADAGLSSIQIAGESRNYTRFADRKKELEDGYAAFLKDFKADQPPITMSVV